MNKQKKNKNADGVKLFLTQPTCMRKGLCYRTPPKKNDLVLNQLIAERHYCQVILKAPVLTRSTKLSIDEPTQLRWVTT